MAHPRLRVLHTADWHLGHVLHERTREYEHGRFLSWLLDTLEEREADALLIAGDVFHAANPPASAWRAWYEFLVAARRRLPRLTVVATAGNHDSAPRLEAPATLLRAMDVHVVGGLAWRADGSLDARSLVVPLPDRDGRTAAWVAAVPFVRPSDLPPPEPGDPEPVASGMRAVYREVLEALRDRCHREQAALAMGHCYMVGGAVSELSERAIQVGHQQALPAEVFPEGLAYVALGHLHRPQRVGLRDSVRYSGSPLPLSMDEAGYPHQVCLAELRGPHLADLQVLEVPRAVDLCRLGPGTPEEVLALLQALPPRDGGAEETRPLLEVRVVLERPQPDLAERVARALEDRKPRLVRLAVRYEGSGESLAGVRPRAKLADLQPEEVFRLCYQRSHPGAPPEAMVRAFRELLEAVQQEAA